MNKYTQAPQVTASPPETLAYRPFAPLAVISLAFAGLFALIVIVWGSVCFSYGAPLVFPTAVLLLPVGAALLAVAARRQILNAEGTRSGMSLAMSAFWISLLFGVGYGALYVGTYLAVWFQAERFTNNWIALVRAGKLNEAFLQTRPPLDRKDEDPNNATRLWVRYGRGAKGELDGPFPSFKENEIIRVLRDPAAKIEQTGLRRWDYDQQSYLVDQSYRVTTPEGTFSLVLNTRSYQSPELKGRQWQLRWKTDEDFESKSFTEMGARLERWRHDPSSLAAASWLSLRRAGNAPAMYLSTLPVAQRTSAQTRYAVRLAASALAATPLTRGTVLGALTPLCDRAAAARAYLDGYAKFDWNTFVHDQDFAAIAQPEDRAHMIGDVHLMLLVPPGPMKIGAKMISSRILPSDDPERVRMAHDVEISEWGYKGSQFGEYFRIDAALVLESEPGDLANRETPQWRIVGLDLLRGGAAPPKQARRGLGVPDR